jgi:predicted DNA-binding transcriptional regulator YafY
LGWIEALVRAESWQARAVKRLTRIVSMALLLSARRRLRAEELAEHFGVSLRTIYRDMASLEEAGFPVAGTAGDGYTIPAAAQLRPLGFEPEEAEALVMAARVLGAGARDSMATHLQSAVAKLEAGLTPEAVRRLSDHRRAVILPGSDTRSHGPLGVLLEAIHDRRVVHIEYDGLARGESTAREIEPLGLVRLGAWWLVSAYCRLRQDLRSFRSDRIRRVEPRDETFAPRDGMTLEDLVERERAAARGDQRQR